MPPEEVWLLNLNGNNSSLQFKSPVLSLAAVTQALHVRAIKLIFPLCYLSEVGWGWGGQKEMLQESSTTDC